MIDPPAIRARIHVIAPMLVTHDEIRKEVPTINPLTMTSVLTPTRFVNGNATGPVQTRIQSIWVERSRFV